MFISFVFVFGALFFVLSATVVFTPEEWDVYSFELLGCAITPED